ncbi:endonuclease/exonuclease/phosphatase family protein [uncultured Williamsia sp.]|uniref:endonuclease/exonuclease/phosphatase family protein n=1 Tax=uncultured Williamsia sp. TaxID=259311 RepID=UPI0026171532|nr:endonuclease/exonuclease/phosphatase family protein [uncultured Williamsia sp.]
MTRARPSARRRRWPSALRVIAVVVVTLLLAAGITAIWLHWYPGRGRFSTALTAGVPIAVAGTAVALVVALVARRWILAGIGVVVVSAGVWTQVPLWVAHTAPTGQRITLVQSNIKLGAGDVDTVARIVADHDATVVTLNEVTPDAAARIEASSLRTLMPHRYVVPGTGGVGSAILSRYPLRDTTLLDGYALNSLRATVELPGLGDTVVYAMHPIPPYPYDSARWVGEMQRIRTELHAQRGARVLVGGDFNATWDHRQFRDLLRDGYTDATETAGGRWLPTYPADEWYGPVIGIDHVVSRGFVATDVHSADVARSDHRALVATLAVG